MGVRVLWVRQWLCCLRLAKDVETAEGDDIPLIETRGRE